ncbi:MAG: SAM-dependent methyltransferase [Clostridiales bacterium]|nr:MAG: SAM-dependent methyltransferase [Clostridiales bacterium]
MKQSKYQDLNSKIIDRWIDEGWKWGIPIEHDVFVDALSGKWDVLLTNTKKVPHDWFGNLKGKKLLGLASGGGQQIPVFSALGAKCTVFDYSDKQLESERMVAEREGYEVELIKGDMTEPLPFENDSFDIVFHPVSNSYIEEVEPVFKECYRVLKKGGILLCGLDIGINYIVDEKEERIITGLPFNPLKNKKNMEQIMKYDSGYQFSHTVSEQIGGQLKAGFVLTNVEDDTNGEGRLHDLGIPSHIMTRAVKL